MSEDIVNKAIERKNSSTIPQIYWEGIYKSYSEVPSYGGHNDASWVNDTANYTRTLLNGSQTAIKEMARKSLLTLLVSIILEFTDKIAIADLGGGMGVNYIYANSVKPENAFIDYHIIEMSDVCAVGQTLYSGDTITFYEPFPAVLPELHIAYVNSALQYMENYRDILFQLAKYCPQYMLFERLSAGPFPTFFTAQVNLPGAVIPYQFINIEEFTSVLQDFGYQKNFQINDPWSYNQHNLPECYRMQYAPNLLFKRVVK